MPCWHAFCTDPGCDGTRHRDATGHRWEQPPGTEYCANCGGYVLPGSCGHWPGPVWTDYRR